MIESIRKLWAPRKDRCNTNKPDLDSNQDLTKNTTIEQEVSEDMEYEVVEIEILPEKMVCPDCGGITLVGLDFCDKCGGEIIYQE